MYLSGTEMELLSKLLCSGRVVTSLEIMFARVAWPRWRGSGLYSTAAAMITVTNVLKITATAIMIMTITAAATAAATIETITKQQ